VAQAAQRSHLRDGASLLVVLGAMAALLAAIDSIPRRFFEPPGGRAFASIPELERRLGERLALPAWFPDSLRWPPARIRFASGRPASVVLGFTGSEGGAERLLLGQSVGGSAPLPAGLWPPGVVLDRAESDVGRIERVQGEDGRVWHQIAWHRWGRLLALRSAGPPDELLRIARGMRREGPP